MSKQDPIGRAKCPHCGKKVAITPTGNYWYHVPAKGSRWNATKGQFKIYCTGSGNSVPVAQRRYISRQQRRRA